MEWLVARLRSNQCRQLACRLGGISLPSLHGAARYSVQIFTGRTTAWAQLCFQIASCEPFRGWCCRLGLQPFDSRRHLWCLLVLPSPLQASSMRQCTGGQQGAATQPGRLRRNSR